MLQRCDRHRLPAQDHTFPSMQPPRGLPGDWEGNARRPGRPGSAWHEQRREPRWFVLLRTPDPEQDD